MTRLRRIPPIFARCSSSPPSSFTSITTTSSFAALKLVSGLHTRNTRSYSSATASSLSAIRRSSHRQILFADKSLHLQGSLPSYINIRTIANHSAPVNNMASGTRLSVKTINPRVHAAQYAVRGELAVKSEIYRQQLIEQAGSLPFEEVISANIGNPQQLGQKPITFFRQVLSILEYPDILKTEYATSIYPEDVIERAKWLLKEIGSVGAYSHSQGVLAIRRSIVKFIEERDGYPSDPNNIFCTVGASAGVNTILTTICSGPNTGILIPVPQYPLYTATLALLHATPVPYYLNESTGWSTDLAHIEEEIAAAKARGVDVKCIVIINPGNPTGASLNEESILSVLDLARKEHLIVIADEVYQTNVFPPNSFVSFKKVLSKAMAEQPDQGFNHVELVSLHSASKGMVGECGHRGGYFELVNFCPEVQAQIYKLASISLCPPVIGQALIQLMVDPPKPGSPSYPLYESEYNAIFETLKTRAYALYDAFKRMKGVSCNTPQGSMYLFPTIIIPPKAVEQAEKEGKKPDVWYCLRMLDETGVCVVPGSGFGQKQGEWHFRTTFLAPGESWIESIVEAHERLWQEFS